MSTTHLISNKTILCIVLWFEPDQIIHSELFSLRVSIETHTSTHNWKGPFGPTHTQGTFFAVTYINNNYIVVGGEGNYNYNYSIYTSNDGITWNGPYGPPNTPGVFFDVTYGNNKYVAVGYDNNGHNSIYTSSDGMARMAQ